MEQPHHTHVPHQPPLDHEEGHDKTSSDTNKSDDEESSIARSRSSSDSKSSLGGDGTGLTVTVTAPVASASCGEVRGDVSDKTLSGSVNGLNDVVPIFVTQSLDSITDNVEDLKKDAESYLARNRRTALHTRPKSIGHFSNPPATGDIKHRKARDLLLLSSLILGAPDWESWYYADPIQMWYYIPLFLRVLRPPSHHKWNLAEHFYLGIKPLFHHEVDESIRQLTFWMSLSKMLPPDAATFFGPPESDQLATQKFFNELGTQKLKGGEEFSFDATTVSNDSLTGSIPTPNLLSTHSHGKDNTNTNTNTTANTATHTHSHRLSSSTPPLLNSTTQSDHAPSQKLCDPIFGVPSPIIHLKVVSIFKAHTRPALCEVTYKDSQLPKRRFIYKKGDDLRDDMHTQVMFYVFNKIWENSSLELKPFIHQYRVFPTSHDTGFVEFVPSKTIQSYDWNKLDEFTPQQKNEFICSAAGAFAGAFILGIRDRHRDNMMISDAGHFFHIDFGYMFNNKTWFDANRFAIPTEIRIKLPDLWDKFLELIGEAYRFLRRNRGMITYFVTKLFASHKKLVGVKFDEPQIIKCLVGAFYDQMAEDEAVLHVRDVASKGEASPKKALKDLVHRIETKKKKI